MQILSSIKYLHDKNLVHRDVKLENIVLNTTCNEYSEHILKLIDFGFCSTNSSNLRKLSGTEG